MFLRRSTTQRLLLSHNSSRLALLTSSRKSSSSAGNSGSSATPSSSSSSPAPHKAIPYPIILQHFLHACNDGNKDVMEPFLHHNFVYEQAPVMPLQPKPTSLFKYDFLKRTVDNRSAFTSRTTEIGQMISQGNIVVVESKATAVLAVDVPKMAKKGDKMEVFATTWFEFDQSTSTIVKMKGYECVGGQ